MPAPIKWLSDTTLGNGGTEGDRLPWVAAMPDGRFVINYTEQQTGGDEETEFQRFGANGVSLSTQGVTVNGALDERMQSSVTLGNGLQAFVWTEQPAAGGGDGVDVYYAILDQNLGTFVPRTLVRGGPGNQGDPAIAASPLPGGGFAIALIDSGAPNGQIVLRLYNQFGAFQSEIVPANATAGAFDNAGDLRDFAITALANGNYALSWTDGSPIETRVRLFSSTGSPVGGDITLDPDGTSDFFPDLTPLADGRLLALYGINPGSSLFGRFISDTGVLDPIPITLATNFQSATNNQPNAAALQDGRFVVVWLGTTNDIHGRLFFSDGTADGAEFVVNIATTGSQAHPTIDVLQDGRFVVAWEDLGVTPPRIVYTIYDPREGNQILVGSQLDDDFFGTGNADAMYMGDGNDIAHGEAGTDFIRGDAGSDDLHGGSEVDLLFGEANADTLFGDDGDDFLYGGVGNDTLSGGNGNDVLYGDENNDLLFGDANNDVLIGGSGVDDLRGGDGNDSIDAGTGNDTVFAGAGADFMAGGDGDDVLIGEGDNDRVDGNAGNDSIDGGTGADTVFAGAGADFIQGGIGGDVLIGEADNDEINGGDNDDSIDGGTGNDILRGDAGTDFIQGGIGDDSIFGGSEADDLRGNEGGDTLTGGAGGDTMYGGTGFDVFIFAVGSGVDVIVDFEDTIDRINLNGYAGATFGNTIIAQSGANTLVTFVGGDQVTLLNFTAANLTAADFVF